MSTNALEPALSAEEIGEALARLTRDGAAVAGGALILAVGDPPQVVWANRAATLLFGKTEPAALSRRLFSPEAGALGEALGRLPKDGAPRFERFRMAHGLRARTVTAALTRQTLASGRRLLVATILDHAGDGLNEAWSISALADADPTQAEAEAEAPANAELDLSGEASPAAAPEPLPSATPLSEADQGRKDRLEAARSSRFLWRTDAEHRLTGVSDGHPDLLGMAGEELAGQSLPRVLADLGCDPEGRLMAALDSKATVSGLRLTWPVRDSRLRVPAVLGAIPVFGAARAFEGYRGFAIVDVTGAVPLAVAPAPAAHAAADPVRHSSMAVAQDGPPDEAGVEASDCEESDMEPAAWPPAEPLSNHGFAHTDVERVPVEPPRHLAAHEQPASAPRRDAQPQSGTIAEPTPAKVIALRPYPFLVPDAEVPPEQASSEDAGTPSEEADVGAPHLSSVERSALQEIARTLGAWAPDGSSGPAFARDRASASAQEPDLAGPGVTHDAPAAADPVRGAARLLDALPVAVWMSVEGGSSAVNRAFLDLTGYRSAEELEERGGLTHLLGEANLASVADDGDDQAFAILEAAGRVVPVQGRSTALTLDGRRIDFLIFKRAAEGVLRAQGLELELRRREAEAVEARQMAEATGEALALFDEEGRLQKLNGACERLFGHARAELVGKAFTTLLAPDSRVTALALVAGLKSPADGAPQAIDVTGRKADATSMPLRMTARRIGSKVCVGWSDQTAITALRQELARVHEEVEQVRGARTDFLAKISHEIRTPLNAILGFAEVILDERFGPIGSTRYRDYIRDIHTSGTQVLTLMHDLLALSKMEAGRFETTPALVDANRVVSECVAQLQTESHRHRVIVRTSLLPRIPLALVDERALRQVVTNILSNAVKFNEPGGQVIVSTAVNDAGAIALRVRDTGVGMSDREIATAMEPFRQITNINPGSGSGLGLPVTKALVEANQATMSIKSRKHEGTLVEIVLRADPDQPRRVPAA